jgi:hypothetical protein
MIETLRTALRNRAVIAIVGVVAVIYVAVEMFMAVEPGTRADEDAAHKPVGAVVSIGCAVIRRIVEVAVRAYRSDTYIDGNLGLTLGRTSDESECKHWKCKELNRDHIVSFVFL